MPEINELLDKLCAANVITEAERGQCFDNIYGLIEIHKITIQSIYEMFYERGLPRWRFR